MRRALAVALFSAALAWSAVLDAQAPQRGPGIPEWLLIQSDSGSRVLLNLRRLRRVSSDVVEAWIQTTSSELQTDQIGGQYVRAVRDYLFNCKTIEASFLGVAYYGPDTLTYKYRIPQGKAERAWNSEIPNTLGEEELTQACRLAPKS